MSQPSDAILTLDGVVKSFGGVRAVDDCSFSVRRGAITGLIGPNGSGKTTTFNLITGLERPEAGRIAFDGRRLHGKPPHAINALGLGRSFQLTRVFGQMTVLENMVVAAPEEQIDAVMGRAMRLLQMIGLTDLRDEFGANLSYGQHKLVEIARVHMRPRHRLILLDEPFAGVNRTLAGQLLEYLARMRDEEGLTYLIIGHEMKLIMRLCEHILVLDQGRLLSEGSPEEIQVAPEVLAAYFGEE